MDRIDLDSLLDLAPDERGAGDSTLTLSRTAWQELVYDREADSYEANILFATPGKAFYS